MPFKIICLPQAGISFPFSHPRVRLPNTVRSYLFTSYSSHLNPKIGPSRSHRGPFEISWLYAMPFFAHPISPFGSACPPLQPLHDSLMEKYAPPPPTHTHNVHTEHISAKFIPRFLHSGSALDHEVFVPLALLGLLLLKVSPSSSCPTRAC